MGIDIYMRWEGMMEEEGRKPRVYASH